MKTLRLIGFGFLVIFFSFSFMSCSKDDGDGGPYADSPFVGAWTTDSYVMGFPSEHVIEFKSDGTYNVISRTGPGSGTWNYDDSTRMLVLTTKNGSTTWIVTNITSKMFALMSLDNANTYVYNRTEKNNNTSSNKTDDSEKIKRIKELVKKNVSFSATYKNGQWKCVLNTDLSNTIEGDEVKYGLMTGNNKGVSFGRYYGESEFCYANSEFIPQSGKGEFYCTPWCGSKIYSEIQADYMSTYGKILDIQERMENGERVSDEEKEWYYDNLDFCNDLQIQLQEMAEKVYWAEFYVQVGDYKFVVGEFGKSRNDKWSGNEEDLYYTKWRPENYGYDTFEFTGDDYGYKFYYCGNFAEYWSCKGDILDWGGGSYLGITSSSAFTQKFRRGGEIVMYSYDTLIVLISGTNKLIEFKRV